VRFVWWVASLITELCSAPTTRMCTATEVTISLASRRSGMVYQTIPRRTFDFKWIQFSAHLYRFLILRLQQLQQGQGRPWLPITHGEEIVTSKFILQEHHHLHLVYYYTHSRLRYVSVNQSYSSLTVNVSESERPVPYSLPDLPSFTHCYG
jgi:hypothetical protein